MDENTDSVVVEAVTEPTFTKEQLLLSKRYADQVDQLNALLDNGKEYPISEVENLLKGFLAKEVK